MKRYLRYLRHKIEYDPWQQTLLNILGKTGLLIQPFYLVMEGTAGLERPIGVDPKTYEIGFLNAKDMDEIGAIPERKISAEILRQRLDDGHLCLGARFKGELAAFTWCNLSHVAYSGYRFSLASNEAYLFDAHTIKAFRGRGLAPHIRYQTYLELEKIGRTRFFSFSVRFNPPSIRFKQKLGARFVDRGLLIKIGKRWSFATHRSRYRKTD